MVAGLGGLRGRASADPTLPLLHKRLKLAKSRSPGAVAGSETHGESQLASGRTHAGPAILRTNRRSAVSTQSFFRNTSLKNRFMAAHDSLSAFS